MDGHALEVLEFDRIRALVAERAESDLGREVALDLAPHAGRDEVALVQEQLREMRDLLAGGAPPPLSGLLDPRRIVDDAHDANRALEPVELIRIRKALEIARSVRLHLAARKEACPRLAALAEVFVDHRALMEAMDAVVEAPGAVRDAASDKLWELRREHARLEGEIRVLLDRVIAQDGVAQALQHRNVTLRNGRFVLAVKQDMRGRVPGLLHGHSQTGSTVFIEPAAAVALGSDLREAAFRIAREEARVLWELSRRVYAERRRILHTANTLAWFDFTLARARFGRDFGLIAPPLADDGVLRLVGAAHPLLVAQHADGGPAPVPIDLRLRQGFRILVITGPNTGGKTVTLKTVGLLQAMFQAGLPIPCAEGSRLPVFRAIWADIGDEQSIAQSLSTFSGHVARIAEVLGGATEHDLVLLDELGAGTDPAEGAALGQAILEELRRRRCAAVVTTHLGALKAFAFSHPDVENACVAFDPATMRPTFELLIGQPGNSNALAVARRFGLADEVLERARALSEAGDGPSRAIMDQLMASRRSLEETRAESERRLQKSRNIEKANLERERHLEKRETRLGREAERTVDEAMRELAERAEPHLRRLGNVPKALKDDLDALAAMIRGSVRATSLAQRRRDYISGLKKGDEVYLPRFEAAGKIRRLDREEETLTVLLGKLPVEVSFDEVALPGP